MANRFSHKLKKNMERDRENETEKDQQKRRETNERTSGVAKMSRTKKTAIVIPEEFLKSFDRFCDRKGYPSRSEAIRSGMRLLMAGNGPLRRTTE